MVSSVDRVSDRDEDLKREGSEITGQSLPKPGLIKQIQSVNTQRG